MKFVLITSTLLLPQLALLACSRAEEVVPSHLRHRDLSGGCSGSRFCFEAHSGQYQAYKDGFCDQYNQCGGNYPNSNCYCGDSSQPRPQKDYIFEQSSDHSSISSYYPYRLPFIDIPNFVDGPDIKSFEVYNVSDTDNRPSNKLATYQFSFLQDQIAGFIEPVVDIPLMNGYSSLLSELKFGFRVMQSGVYEIETVASANTERVRNGFQFDIKDREYQPIKELNFRATLRTDVATVELLADTDYLMNVFSYLTGQVGDARLSWTIRKV